MLVTGFGGTFPIDLTDELLKFEVVLVLLRLLIALGRLTGDDRLALKDDREALTALFVAVEQTAIGIAKATSRQRRETLNIKNPYQRKP
ncbi:hypothetical protein [Acinetobacter baumannii]|uniref:hypothetical protein n=1 Tax=Acinetobacter baumannii TaxID=470 RepID=UPI001C07471D|nr:hypothetical protein [Acinetobacter baumannii]